MSESHRRPPNALIDVFSGPAAAPPNVRYRIAVPARLVKTSIMIDQMAALLSPLWYLTMLPPAPTLPFYAFAGGVFSADYRLADRVALTTGGPATHYVWREELFSFPLTVPYYRVWIRPLPTP